MVPQFFGRLSLAASLAFVWLPSIALAQAAPYAAKGRLIGLEPGLITIQVPNKPPQTVKFLKPGSKELLLKGKGPWSFKSPLAVVVTGVISPSQLAVGTLVRFRGFVDKEGNVTSDVREVTALLDPKRDERAGLYPDQPEEGASGEGTPLLVKGIVASNRKGTLIVNVGVKGENTNKGKVTAQLTDSTTVKVESENLARARMGDEIEITGVQVDGRDIAAEKVVVTLRRVGGKPIGSGSAKNKPKKEPAASDSADKKPDEGEKKKKKGKTVIVN